VQILLLINGQRLQVAAFRQHQRLFTNKPFRHENSSHEVRRLSAALREQHPYSLNPALLYRAGSLPPT